MEVYHWVLYGMDLLVILTLSIAGYRTIAYLVNSSRDERRETTSATNKVIKELTNAIVTANSRTTIFQSEGSEAQIGSNTTIDEIKTKGGDAVMGDQT